MPSYKEILSKAWPIILSNASVPLLGIVDTAVIGQQNDIAGLGALALSSLIFTFVYWSFGFLRMGTTGFIAQHAGADDQKAIGETLARSVTLALVIGILIIAAQALIISGALKLLHSSDDIEQLAEHYFYIRIWGAPMTLCTFVIMGFLIGLGESKKILWTQLFLNISNMILDILFANLLDLGVTGIAVGTLIAETTSTIFCFYLTINLLRTRGIKTRDLFKLDKLLDKEKIMVLLTANTDIMIRTLMLIFSFAWFTRQSALFSDATLSANHILLQFISFCAFFLDGYAHVTESFVGQSIGRKNADFLTQSMRKSCHLAAITAIVLAAITYLGGDYFIQLLSNNEPIRNAAMSVLPFCALYILCSFAAFQLDGIFIGAMLTRQMRHAAIISTFSFVILAVVLSNYAGNIGLWIAFILYVCVRALTLYIPFLHLSKEII